MDWDPQIYNLIVVTNKEIWEMFLRANQIWRFPIDLKNICLELSLVLLEQNLNIQIIRNRKKANRFNLILLKANSYLFMQKLYSLKNQLMNISRRSNNSETQKVWEIFRRKKHLESMLLWLVLIRPMMHH